MPIYWETFGWDSFATLTAGLGAAGAAFVIGRGQLAIQRSQTALQRSQVAQKELELRIHLLQRRLETWEALNDSVDLRLREILSEDIRRPEWPVSEALPRFWVLKRQLILLFSSNLEPRLDELDRSLQRVAYAKAQLQVAAVDVPNAAPLVNDAFHKLEHERDRVGKLREEIFTLIKSEGSVTKAPLHI